MNQTFMMGEFEASFPDDRFYVRNHMWGQSTSGAMDAISSETSLRFGLTAYAVRLLQDVYFLDFEVDAPTTLTARQTLGSIESKKAESDLFSPVAGDLVSINEETLDDPALINADPYGEGWLVEIIPHADSVSELMRLADYLQHLEEAWVVAQRTIKGQLN